MKPNSIVKPFDVVEEPFPSSYSGDVLFIAVQLHFEGVEEAFADSVVKAVSSPAHALRAPRGTEQRAKAPAGKRATLIRVNDQTVARTARLQGAPKRGNNKLLVVSAARRPADNFA